MSMSNVMLQVTSLKIPFTAMMTTIVTVLLSNVIPLVTFCLINFIAKCTRIFCVAKKERFLMTLKL